MLTEAGFGADMGMEKFFDIKDGLLSKLLPNFPRICVLKTLKKKLSESNINFYVFSPHVTFRKLSIAQIMVYLFSRVLCF